MNIRRHFIPLGVLAATAALALGQGVIRAAAQNGATTPDFSGVWTHPYFPGFEPPASGPGPILNRSRIRGGPRDGVGNANQFVGDYTSPILKPQAAEVVKKHGEISLAGGTYPTPSNQCWPSGVPYIFFQHGLQNPHRQPWQSTPTKPFPRTASCSRADGRRSVSASAP
jgi:hypothetical protein